MDRQMASNVLDNLELIYSADRLQNKRIFLTPVNEYSRIALLWLRAKGIEVSGILDQGSQYCEEKLCGVPITEISKVPATPYTLILVAFYNCDAIMAMPHLTECQIINLFFMQPGRGRKKLLEKNKYVRLAATFLKNSLKVMRGWKVYKRILSRRSGEKTRLYLFPWNSLGDVYILGLFNKAQCRKFCGEFIFAVIGQGCRTVAEMTGFKDIEVLTQDEMDCLIKFKIFVGETDTEILHFSYHYTNIVYPLFHYKPFSFIDFYKIYNFDEEVTIRDLRYYEGDALQITLPEEVKRLIAPGKTVILAPFQKSMPDFSVVFWERLAEILKEKGYNVLTNCSGKLEYPIYGTESLSFSLTEADNILSYAGYFVAARSGLCDVINGAKCRKIIIYPYTEDIYEKPIERCSLRSMFSSENTEELVYGDSSTFLDRIVSSLMNN